MALSEELARLHELHRQGALSDDEFVTAKAKALASDGVAAVNAMRRSSSERWVAGVCGGLAAVTGLAPWAWRLIFAVLTLWGGAGLLIYVLLWIFVPAAQLIEDVAR
jgi:phage shock protein C